MDKESRMKIISYNINKSTIAKIKYLLEQDADVYVIPEISEDIRNTLPSEYEMEYLGDIPSKGLGVIWRKGMCKLPQWYKDDYKQLSYAIPLIYDDVLILGIWPTNYKRKKTYTTLAKEIIEKYIPHFSEFKQCIITGDFNLYHKKDFPNKFLLVSIMGRNNEEWEYLAKESEKAGADALELNFSCPNMTTNNTGSSVGQSRRIYKGSCKSS